MTNPPLQLTLNPDGVAAPAHRAAVICREIIDLYFDALSRTDLSQKPPASKTTFFRADFRGPDLSAEERRNLHEAWLLAKVFQDLVRGVRGSLEEAYLFIELLSAGPLRVSADSTIENIAAPFKAKANGMNFPDLLRYVNARLENPLQFADAYQSLQNARNCLEHRDGIVRPIDARDNGAMELRFPRVKFFVQQDGQEVELYPNFYAETDTTIMMRLDIRKRSFSLGERLTITADDFNEIAFACAKFGTDLATQLPKSAELTCQ
jgi:hypothetical protein